MHGQWICGEGLEEEIRLLGLMMFTSQCYPVPVYKWFGFDSFGFGLCSHEWSPGKDLSCRRSAAAELRQISSMSKFIPTWNIEAKKLKSDTTQKFWEILQFTNWNQVWIFFQQKVFPFYYGKNLHFSIKKLFPCTSHTPHLDLLILINFSFPKNF